MIAVINEIPDALEKYLADDGYDSSRFQQRFGYNTRMGLTEDLQREVAWYRSQTHSKSS